MPATKREGLLVAAAFALAAVVLTLPLALDLKRTLPSDLVDTLFTTWVIGWDADRLQHGLRGVWDAPIFFPYRGALGFSENLLGVAVFVAPLYWLTGDPVLTYNAAFLLSFVIAGLGMYLLARELTGHRAAAFAAGVYYAFGPFRMAQIAHIQMVATGWMPIALWGLHRYFRSRRPGWLAVLAGAWILQALSNMYIGYFIALPVALVAADGLRASRGSRARALWHLTIAGILAAAIMAPVAAAYLRARIQFDQSRSLDEIAALSADVRSYVVGKNTVGVWRWLPTAVSTDPERELFPGVFAVALAGLGLWASRQDPRLTRWARLYAIIAGAAALLSLGPIVHVWGAAVTTQGPYGWLLHVVPGMAGMRVPARFAIVVVAGLSVLIACGVAWLLDRVAPRARPAAIAACLIAIIADGFAAPIPVVAYSARGRVEDRSVASWLASRGPGAVLHLPPIPAEHQILHSQFMTLTHRHPIVNGYSGSTTPLIAFLGSASSPLYDTDRFGDTVRMLRSLGVRYVVIHPGNYDAAAKADGLADHTFDAFRASDQIVWRAGPGPIAFELQPWNEPARDAAVTPIDVRELTASASESPDRLANLFDGDPDSRWIGGLGGQDGSSWIRVQLTHPADVAEVALQIAERSMTDYPRMLRIEAEDAAGRRRVVYERSPYPELGAAIVRDGRYPNLVIALPHNETAALWIRQTAATRASWSIHELRLSRYDASGGTR